MTLRFDKRESRAATQPSSKQLRRDIYRSATSVTARLSRHYTRSVDNVNTCSGATNLSKTHTTQPELPMLNYNAAETQYASFLSSGCGNKLSKNGCSVVRNYGYVALSNQPRLRRPRILARATRAGICQLSASSTTTSHDPALFIANQASIRGRNHCGRRTWPT